MKLVLKGECHKMFELSFFSLQTPDSFNKRGLGIPRFMRHLRVDQANLGWKNSLSSWIMLKLALFFYDCIFCTC